MDATNLRRRRLERLLSLAQAYRGWSRKQLARELGRDPTKLVPGTGIPKLDLVVQLSRVLDWPVGEVVGHLWQNDAVAADHQSDGDFESVNKEAGDAYRAGDYLRMVELAEQAFAIAETPDERARACNREAGAWDGMGRYTEVLAALTRGLQEKGISPVYRRMLQSNLANAYYTLWALVEARSIAQDLIDWFRRNPPANTHDRKTQAFAHYVSGHTYRRLISLEPDRAGDLAALAKADLAFSRDHYRCLATELDDASLAGIANVCEGGLVEVGVELGEQSAQSALKSLAGGLDNAHDGDDSPVGTWLESYGWWCIFGCNLALRHVEDERQLQQHMAVFTNKADEIANRLNNWAMRERVFTMHYTRWERASGTTGFDIPCVIDTDDVRIITGTMGRFPMFRETGWRILQSAQVVDGS